MLSSLRVAPPLREKSHGELTACRSSESDCIPFAGPIACVIRFEYDFPMMNRILLVTSLLDATTCAQARVVRIVVEQRESPAFRGQAFGKAGQYETLSGRFY